MRNWVLEYKISVNRTGLCKVGILNRSVAELDEVIID